MSKIDELVNEIKILKNSSSVMKFDHKLFVPKDNTLDDLLPVNPNDYFDDAMQTRYAFFYNELGDFFIGIWEFDLKKSSENKDNYNKTGDITVFARNLGNPFEFVKGYNLYPVINFKDVSFIEIEILSRQSIIFERSSQDSKLFTEEKTFALQTGILSDTLILTERSIEASSKRSKFSIGKSKDKTREVKISKLHSIKFKLHSNVGEYPPLELDFLNAKDLVKFLSFIVEYESSTYDRSVNYEELILNSSEEKINTVKSYLLDLEKNSKFPIFSSKEIAIYEKFFKQDGYGRDYFLNEYKKIISSRTANVGSENLIFYPDIAQYFTIIETDKILIENGMKDYGLYEITRSSHPEVNKGINFYSFDDDDNLLMMAPPYRVMGHNKSQYIIFDATLYESNKVVRIPKSEILSYKLYGTELMQSTVSTNARPNEVQVSDNNVSNAYERPSITGTFFSSLLFGSTYTLLNGVGKALHNQTNMLGDKLDNLGGKLDKVVEAINSISITTDHKIIDTSRVQIVLTNRRDLEIDGINIFYDLNRVYPNLNALKNPSIKEVEHKSNSESSSNIADEVLKLKQLLDQGVIDEEEFKAMKKKLI